MKGRFKTVAHLLICFALGLQTTFAGGTNNQTNDLSPINSEASLPFSVEISLANFQLPQGFHSGALGVFQGKWIFIAGRINGLHGFGADPFPTDQQNTTIFVVNPATGTVTSRSLTDPSSGLSQSQIDSLSVTSPQWYQEGNTLYMTGGYGFDTNSGIYNTKPILTAFNLPGILQWVMHPENTNLSVVKNIQQIYNPIFQIAGGEMFNLGGTTQLVFGQNFTGEYTDGSNGDYSEQVRQFKIKNMFGHIAVDIYPSIPQIPNPNYRRRDLNIMPVLLNNNNLLKYALVAYAGVFTLDSGVWTVPVVIDDTGTPSMADPSLPSTFKQGMNQYVCATAGLYSRRNASMYNIFFGGMSYGFYDGDTFTTDPEIPFINQVTTVQINKYGQFSQYLMNNQYPVILSTGANPGNQLLFGAGAYFINNNISMYPNGVINLDNIRQPTVIGYIVGGIQSTLPNTNVDSDSSASPYVFTVTLVPK